MKWWWWFNVYYISMSVQSYEHWVHERTYFPLYSKCAVNKYKYNMSLELHASVTQEAMCAIISNTSMKRLNTRNEKKTQLLWKQWKMYISSENHSW